MTLQLKTEGEEVIQQKTSPVHAKFCQQEQYLEKSEEQKGTTDTVEIRYLFRSENFSPAYINSGLSTRKRTV